MWIALLKSVLSIAGYLTEYMSRKQLLDAGAASALKENYKDALDKINKADAARRAAADDVDSLPDDPNNRDN